jgi:HEPN domain-containing protein
MRASPRDVGQPRYPNGLPDDIPARVYNRVAAEGALALAEEVVDQVNTWFATDDSAT